MENINLATVDSSDTNPFVPNPHLTSVPDALVAGAREVPSAESSGDTALRLLSGKWKLAILSSLFGREPLRFSEIRRSLGLVTRGVLAQQLRALEKEGILHRKVFSGFESRVEYSMTPVGKTLKPIVEALRDWKSQSVKV